MHDDLILAKKITKNEQEKKKSIIVGLSGGSGVIYGIRLLEYLKKIDAETHLIISPAARITIASETDYDPAQIEKLGSKVHRFNDIAASISSGSFEIDGMVIIPCSMDTLGAIASGVTDNLLTRAAEVTLKEKRPLVLVPRETPLSLIHLENMRRVASAGAIVAPAMPAFYHRPKTVDDIINHLIGRVLDLLKIENELFRRWKGLNNSSQVSELESSI